MASYVRNVGTKYYYNRITLFQVTIFKMVGFNAPHCTAKAGRSNYTVSQ